MQRLVEGFNRTRLNDEINYRFHNHQSKNDKAIIKNPCETRDMGVMCEVSTRDVGISHQQVIKTKRKILFKKFITCQQMHSLNTRSI